MTPKKQRQPPNIAFLGICEKAMQVREGSPFFWKYNIIGLRQAMVLHVFPHVMQASHLAFAIYDAFNFEKARLSIIDPSGREIYHQDVELYLRDEVLIKDYIPRADVGVMVQSQEVPGWSFLLFPRDTLISIDAPGKYELVMSRGLEKIPLGTLLFFHAPAPPLTEERIAAIRSNPHSTKQVMMIYQCNICEDKIQMYAGIERDDEEEKKGFVWYKDLPEKFNCRCGNKRVDLSIFRENGHWLINNGVVLRGEGELEDFSRLYNSQPLEAITNEFAYLLDKNPSEQVIQEFIEDNPVLLHQFAAEKLFVKSPILSKYKTDFTVLSNNGDLILIEIERANLQLLKQDGGRSADLQHAFDQVRDWLHTAEHHRAAVLECMGVKSEEVTNIRGVVLAGRDGGYDSEHLRRLKWDTPNKVTFYTYDDLIRAMIVLLQRIKKL